MQRFSRKTTTTSPAGKNKHNQKQNKTSRHYTLKEYKTLITNRYDPLYLHADRQTDRQAGRQAGRQEGRSVDYTHLSLISIIIPSPSVTFAISLALNYQESVGLTPWVKSVRAGPSLTSTIHPVWKIEECFSFIPGNVRFQSDFINSPANWLDEES